MKPTRTLFVGDTFESDVVGSKRVGMDIAWLRGKGAHVTEPTHLGAGIGTVWQNRKAERSTESAIQPDYILSRLDELVEILQSELAIP